MKTRLQSGSVSGILSSVAITCTTVSMVCLVASGVANATPLILNGGFESGFTSWTRLNQLGSEGAFSLQTGTVSPVNGDPVPPPPGGMFAAMTDALGPGSHVLSGRRTTLRFQDMPARPTALSREIITAAF